MDRSNDNLVVGIIGLSDPILKILDLAKTDKRVELKILYVDKNYQKRGVGTELIGFVENQAKKQRYLELLVRSAEKYKYTAWEFYEKMGFKKIGTVTGGDEIKFIQVFSKLLY
ncbi:MAG: hypothetical protein UU14_C0023G0005 [Candidatus Roizmanbacteria bacterium GW2011_GWB1_40_7]|uniref:N-acetyltransferase domain-containing protein n=2 Tax=Candidatus Roizmaniibacteriota TaxID=1752723 RepID=A0A0G0VHY5_9BACT|nr:MAG: hypothetical protein UT85_C0041G0009 [Candidatus Levybacteria bacterium GW2011_GWA2_40_16]KKR71605.1 MAG: hypothetical protein UU14_C0023G0005 [Candidatus Roizmanbacteria bacterium GW2011_GWB1_40_7]KKR90899.1 MAG: hypothetical protein UU41_C0053G0003 [Candidatus Roizmanbacteria bacterium GW2011_GWA1_41_13]